MTFKKKALPGSIAFNKLADGLPEKREKLKAHSIPARSYGISKTCELPK